MGTAGPAPDVAIIGGGIVGSATAAFLAEAGLGVRLFEREAVAAGASGRNSGIIQHPFDPVLAGLYHASVAAYRDLAAGSADPAAASGDRFRLAAEPAGLLLVGLDAAAARHEADAWAAAWPATAPAFLDGPALRALEPALAGDLAACRLEIGYPVAPASATEAFAELARRLGAEFAIGREARPEVARGRVVGVRVDGRVHSAGTVVVAAGPWTPAVVDPTGRWQPIVRSWGVVASVALAEPPRHGLEAIDLAVEPDEEAAPRLADDAVGFSLVPALGSSALGSTFLPAEPDPAAWVDRLRRVGSRYVPAVADAPLLGLRRCARPVSRDGRPLIGAAPWADGLWIVAGHGPWGISTGPGSARLAVDRLLGRPDAAAFPAELAVGRFGPPVG